MTERRLCPPAPGPLEAYAAQFDPLFGTLAQRRNFREYLQGLLLPRDRNKTLTGLAGAEPVVEAQAGAVQRLQFFLSESPWDAEAVNASRLALLLGDPATAPHADGVLVIDDTGDRKAGTHTAHVARQWLGSIGKVDNGIVAVSSLWAADLPYVVRLKPSKGTWAKADAAHTPEDAARQLGWEGPTTPGEWTAVERRFRDGHSETWWAAELTFSGYGPDRRVRLVVATTDPATLPAISTWYLATNLPRPGSPRAADSAHVAAELEEVVRLYGLRNWVEQGYKQVKHELGWADFMVRSDRAIRRHWQLVCCAFSFCWRAWFAEEAGTAGDAGPTSHADASACANSTVPAGLSTGRGENGGRFTSRHDRHRRLASDPPPSARLVGPLGVPLALVASVVNRAPTSGDPSPPSRRRDRLSAPPLPPGLTNHR